MPLVPSQTAQQTLRLLDRNWKSFFRAMEEWSKDKSKFNGQPKLPKYKKKNGRSVTIFTNQQCKIKDGYLTFPRTDLRLKTRITGNLRGVRIIPKGSIYVVEIVYEKEIAEVKRPPKRIGGIDLGLNNFVTLVNNIDIKPIVINGKVIKSINQYYNKKKAELMSYVGDRGTSNRIEKYYDPSRRIKRGLFRSDKGILINADVNSAYNIIKKVFPEAFAEGIEGVGLHPVRLNIA
ncbi:MAG: transposase [Caldanaerobacter subterraneus]|nr:transposase [Caldanaerobacter subterraneus]